jgi:adenine-specific DNA methylase
MLSKTLDFSEKIKTLSFIAAKKDSKAETVIKVEECECEDPEEEDDMEESDSKKTCAKCGKKIKAKKK